MRVEGLGFWAQALGFRAKGLGFRDEGFGLSGEGLGRQCCKFGVKKFRARMRNHKIVLGFRV